jgi:hypothetical protein
MANLNRIFRVGIFVALGCSVFSQSPAEVLFSNGAESVSSVATAASQGLFSDVSDNGGTVSISSNYAHSGTKSFRFCYGNNEAQAALEVVFPTGQKHVFLQWWELRERAGDFPGAQNFDWAGEKVMRLRSKVIENTGVDYPLGWAANTGGVDSFGTPGLDNAGILTIFGNSTASNGRDLVSLEYPMARGEWHQFQMELDLGTLRTANGAARLWIDGKLKGQATSVNLLPSVDATIGIVWIGGWYSGSAGPNPSPACRYVDDIVISTTAADGGAGVTSNPPVPNPPTDVTVR